jgi:hypothetical protein
MVQKESVSLQKGELVYFPLDNMLGMITDIRETHNNVDKNIIVEWFIDNRIVIGSLTVATAIRRRQDYLNIFC